MDNNCKIIKLKSGETLICKLTKVLEKTVILERPMVFKTMPLPPEIAIMAGEALVMKNWLEFSADKTVEIPIDHIAALIKPDMTIFQCYEMEKEKEDNPALKQQYMEDLMKKLSSKKQSSSMPDKLNINFSVPDDMIPDVLDALGIDIPDPDDIIDEEDEEILPEPPVFQEQPPKKKKKKKKIQDKSKNKDEFGNDWSDWSPDPNDYLK
jgi:hypothetical protein